MYCRLKLKYLINNNTVVQPFIISLVTLLAYLHEIAYIKIYLLTIWLLRWHLLSILYCIFHVISFPIFGRC